MRNRIIFIFILLLLFTATSFPQPRTVFKKHLFLGKWQLISDKYDIIEEWQYIDDTLYIGRTYMIVNNDTNVLETLRLCYIDNIFCYCSTLPDQNEGKEIIFKLKHIENYGEKLTFENSLHDFPQKIVYEFFSDNRMTATIEGIKDNVKKKTEYNFSKIPSIYDIAILTGKLIKKQFVNKAGRLINGVYDYFFEIEETPYFIRFCDNCVSLEEIEKYINNEVKLHIVFKWGLWDADDENYQSRIGRYINILEIIGK